MNFMEWLGLLLSLGILVYLVVALLYPEKFQ
jgi:K+-transporting ATPase KdpF subunit